MEVIEAMLAQYLTPDEVDRVAKGEAHAVFRQPIVHERVTVRCYEMMLRRQLGYSRKEAKAIISSGWK